MMPGMATCWPVAGMFMNPPLFSLFHIGKERQYLGHDFFHGIGYIRVVETSKRVKTGIGQLLSHYLQVRVSAHVTIAGIKQTRQLDLEHIVLPGWVSDILKWQPSPADKNRAVAAHTAE